jgi:hypothetical protein
VLGRRPTNLGRVEVSVNVVRGRSRSAAGGYRPAPDPATRLLKTGTSPLTLEISCTTKNRDAPSAPGAFCRDLGLATLPERDAPSHVCAPHAADARRCARRSLATNGHDEEAYPSPGLYG